ncbi:hypothetical protein ACM64Y_08540 [Novispirillum sp. DQ9]|uniref:hypothetical protein n=1 Tax=Novispirillum sp. DQ9 TaxID=3398612 RepID=UPI003C7EB4A7
MITLPSLSALTASASSLTTAVATSGKAAKVDTSILDQWEATRRETEEKILKDRLNTAEKMAQALQPLMIGALSLPGGAGARPLAGALEALSREVRSIAADMSREFKHQERLAGQGNGKVSSAFHAMLDKAGMVMARTEGMLIGVGSNDDHPPGRLSARDIAERGARNMLDARDDFRAVANGLSLLRISRVDVRA